MKRSKSSFVQRIHRVNAAVELCNKHTSVSQVAGILSRRYQVTERQAYRYIREAMQIGQQQAVPQEKAVFTVRLPQGLIARLRIVAKESGQTMSKVVADILARWLQNHDKHGPKAP